MIRVLYLINHAGKAGTEKYVKNLINSYHKKSAECFMAYGEPGLLSEEMEEMGIPLFKIKMSKPYDIVAAYKLSKYCRKNKIDIIHTQYPRENYIAILSKLFYKKPQVVYTCHLTLEVSRFWYYTNRIFTRFNKCILSVCNNGKDLMIKNGVLAEKIKVVFNGLHPDEIKRVDSGLKRELSLDEDTFVIATLARYSPEKGLSYFVRAMDKLKKITDRKFACVIAGDGELFDEIREQVKSLGLEQTVFQLGFRRDVDNILCGSDLFVNSAKCNEALSFAILEALGKGLPVVATAIGGNGDIINEQNDCGYLVEFDNDEEMAQAINKIMDDGKLYERFSKNAVYAVKSVFNFDNISKQIFETYIN